MGQEEDYFIKVCNKQIIYNLLRPLPNIHLNVLVSPFLVFLDVLLYRQLPCYVILTWDHISHALKTKTTQLLLSSPAYCDFRKAKCSFINLTSFRDAETSRCSGPAAQPSRSWRRRGLESLSSLFFKVKGLWISHSSTCRCWVVYPTFSTARWLIKLIWNCRYWGRIYPTDGCWSAKNVQTFCLHTKKGMMSDFK